MRTRKPVDIEGASKTIKLYFTLKSGATISGQFVDEKGTPIQITSGASGSSQRIDMSGQKNLDITYWGSGNVRNRYHAKERTGDVQSRYFFSDREGDYKEAYMDFPTPSTFIIQGVLPGKNLLRFYPRIKGRTVKEISYKGKNITDTGINQERAQGTIRLILANALPRGKLLWSKFLAGFIIILISLTTAVFVALLIMVLHPAISVNKNLYLRIIAMWGISALYLGVFFTISLLISTMVQRPSTALLILLQIWIVVIVIYPNVSVILSDHIVKLPSQDELDQRKKALFGPFEREYEQLDKAFDEAIESRTLDSVGHTIMLKKVNLAAKRTTLFHQVNSDYSRQLTRQVQLAQYIATFSPSVLYDSVMSRLASTDIREYDAFMQGVERHWRKIVKKERLNRTDVEVYKAFKFPQFTYSKQSVAESLVSTLHCWIILFFLAVVFFATAHTIFQRKDVA